jgi:hypothetical protein
MVESAVEFLSLSEDKLPALRNLNANKNYWETGGDGNP